jgi:hypothetical protein
VKVPFDLLRSGSKRNEQVVVDGETMVSLVALYSTLGKKSFGFLKFPNEKYCEKNKVVKFSG